MNRALFGFMVRRHRLSIGLLMLPPILLGVVLGFLYPTYQESRSFLQNFMPTLQKVLTGGVLDLFSATGIFSFPFGHPLTMAAYACAAALPALSLPSGERGRGGLDLLLATRLERRELIRTVFLFQVAVAAMFALMPLLGSWIGALIADVDGMLDFWRFFLVSVKLFLVISWLGGLALMLSVLCQDRGQTARWYGSIVFACLLANLTGELWSTAKFLVWCNPFGFIRVPFVLTGADGFLRDVLVLAVSALALAVVAMHREHRGREA